VIAYLDTSIILLPLLGQGRGFNWRKWDFVYSSELLALEARRTIDRLRLEMALDDMGVAGAQQELSRIEQHIGIVPLNRTVLRRSALPMPTVVKTLDAIHLTSALILQENKRIKLTFATHDLQQATAAKAFGFEVLGV